MEISKENLQFLMSGTLRYCLGKKSYVPNWWYTLLEHYLYDLDVAIKQAWLDEIREHLQETEYSCNELDIQWTWEDAIRLLREEVDDGL